MATEHKRLPLTLKPAVGGRKKKQHLSHCGPQRVHNNSGNGFGAGCWRCKRPVKTRTKIRKFRFSQARRARTNECRIAQTGFGNQRSLDMTNFGLICTGLAAATSQDRSDDKHFKKSRARIDLSNGFMNSSNVETKHFKTKCVSSDTSLKQISKRSVKRRSNTSVMVFVVTMKSKKITRESSAFDNSESFRRKLCINAFHPRGVLLFEVTVATTH